MKDNLAECIGMKAIDAINKLGTKNVKIGTKDGTAFFYCGAVDNVLNAKWVEEILKSNLERRISVSTERFWTFIRNHPTPAKYITSKLNEGKDFSYEEYIEVEKEYFRKVRVKKDNIEKLHKLKKEQKPYKDRIVQDAYMAITEEDCAVIIIDGVELGEYWTLEEYRAKRSKDEKEV